MSIITISISPLLSYCPAHSHEIWEIVLNQQGEGYMVIGNNEYSYHPGTIICQPPNIPHTKYSNVLFRDVYIQLSSFSLSSLSNTDNVIIFQDDSEKNFEILLLMANHIYHKKEKNYQHILNSLSETMEQLLISWYQHTPHSSEIEQLKNTIVDSFTNPEFSIIKLLSEGTYCIDHLRRLFKQETGFTPLEYLTDLRLNHAKKLMQENDVLHYKISEISIMCGFYDNGYFYRVFKKKTNMTPSEYLNMKNESIRP